MPQNSTNDSVHSNNGGNMENQFNYANVIENLSTQIASQAQQIAVLQAILQSLVPEAEEETPEEVTETPEG